MGVSLSDVTGIGEVAGLARDVVNRFWPDKSEEERMMLASSIALVQGEIEINKIEAASPSLWKSGWRPGLGWVCVAACSWNWLGLPLAAFMLQLYGSSISLKPADLTEMWPILITLLGLGGYRTVERVKGKA